MITLEHLLANAATSKPPHRAQHRRRRARLTERGGYVVTVALTLAVFALVCVAATMLGGAR